MKSRKLTKFILFVVAMVTILTSCSGNPSASQAPAGNQQTAAAQPGATAQSAQPQGSSDEAEMDGNMYKTGLPIVKEKETYKIAWSVGSYCNLPPAEKQATLIGEEETNVHIEWMEIEGTGWTEKVNIMLASQDLPDAFLGNIGDSFNKNLEAFHDVSGLIDEYAPTLRKAIEEYPVIQTYLTQMDGSIRSLATNQMLKKDETSSTVYWINQAWLDKVGRQMPSNTDELYEVLVAFRDEDPNGNNQKDEVPLTFVNQDWAGKFSSLLGPFGVLKPDNHVLVENGVVTFQPAKDGLYDALQYYHKLQSEGLIDPEGFSQTTAQSVAKMNQDIHGIIACYDPLNKIGPDHTFVPLKPIMGANGTTMYEGSIEPKVTHGLLITVACKNPAVLVRYYDYVNSDFKRKLTWNYGPEGFLWTLNDDQTWYQIEDNLEEGEVWDRIRYTVGFGPSCFAFFTPSECEQIMDRFVQGRLDAIDLLTPYYPLESYHALPDEAADASEKNLIKTELDAYVNNFIATCLMEGIDEAKWQKHLDTCASLNVARYEELMQKTYDAFNAISN